MILILLSPSPDEIQDREQRSHVEQVVAVEVHEEDHEDEESMFLLGDIAVDGQEIQRQERDEAGEERVPHDLQQVGAEREQQGTENGSVFGIMVISGIGVEREACRQEPEIRHPDDRVSILQIRESEEVFPEVIEIE